MEKRGLPLPHLLGAGALCCWPHSLQDKAYAVQWLCALCS